MKLPKNEFALTSDKYNRVVYIQDLYGYFLPVPFPWFMENVKQPMDAATGNGEYEMSIRTSVWNKFLRQHETYYIGVN